MRRTIEEQQAIREARRVVVDQEALQIARERDTRRPRPPAPIPWNGGTATLVPNPDNPNKWGWIDNPDGVWQACEFAVSQEGIRRFLLFSGWRVDN